MEYYLLKEHDAAGNIICPKMPSTTQIWEGKNPLLIEGTIQRQETDIRFLSFYQATVFSKAFLVPSQVWEIWKETQRIARFRPCVLGYVPKKVLKPYVFVMPRILEALHKETEYLRNGDIKRICLNRSRIGTNRVFAVKGEIQISLIVGEDVLEEMLRGRAVDFQYEHLETKEG